MSEENKEEEQKPEDTGSGVQSEAEKDIERINSETERLNKAIAENENAKARAKLAGITLNSAEDKPHEETAEEYADKIVRGE